MRFSNKVNKIVYGGDYNPDQWDDETIERDMEYFLEKLQSYEDVIEYVTPLTRNSWGRQVMRFYDLDGNLIEVAGEG